MHILVVISHPDQRSLSHAIAAKFEAGAIKAGHTCEVADLHAEGFDPRWSLEDIEQDTTGIAPKDILSEQARIDRCDVVCMVFPLFWFGMPAMLKGWLERAWSWGWAYDQLVDHNQSLQRDREAILLVPAGANPDKWPPYRKIEQAMTDIWCTGTLGYFGFKKKTVHYLNGSTGSASRRAALLAKAYQAGLDAGKPGSGPA